MTEAVKASIAEEVDRAAQKQSIGLDTVVECTDRSVEEFGSIVGVHRFGIDRWVAPLLLSCAWVYHALRAFQGRTRVIGLSDTKRAFGESVMIGIKCPLR